MCWIFNSSFTDIQELLLINAYSHTEVLQKPVYKFFEFLFNTYIVDFRVD